MLSRVIKRSTVLTTGVTTFLAGIGVGAAGIATVVALAVVAILTAVVGVCVGAWVFLGPVNYFGCGQTRPANIIAAELVGTYETADGGRLQLFKDGTLQAEHLNQDESVLSGPGRWSLSSSDSAGDVQLIFLDAPGTVGEELNISGTRENPELYWYLGDPD